MTNAPHVALPELLQRFGTAGNELTVGGIPVTRLAERVGSTPFYAYDRGIISRRVAELRDHLPKDVHVHYAMKANPMPAVVHHLASLVDGLDVASAREMAVALDTGVSPRTISFAGPGKSFAEIRRAVAAGITLNIESQREFESACSAANELGTQAHVAVRVNPSFELKAAGMKMGGAAQQFGIDAEVVPALLRRIQNSGARFEGFHIFSGSQNLRPEAIIEAQAKSLALVLELVAASNMSPPTANIGGGFGIPYTPVDRTLDVSVIGQRLDEAMSRLRSNLPDTRVVIELGRFLIGEAGIYVCRVIDRKVSRGQVFLVTDGGMHHHLSASGNFGQVIRRNFPVVVANHLEATERETVQVVGPLCTPLDLLGNAVDLPKADVGDLIAVLQSGAYGITASPTAFLSHPSPSEVLV
jgi:diaminopimelate decarboxylase